MPKTTKPCGVPMQKDRYGEPDHDGPLCVYPRKHGKVKCQWHWFLTQPIEVQIKAADVRASLAEPLPKRGRVPEREWPAGERWCAGCQSFVPLFYVSGSRCRACNSKAAHASHVQRTYNLSPEEYQALLEWQGGRCYICRQVPRVRRLAVDHDHETDEVRGLLCANDEWGCNVQLRRLLNDLGMARRALEYVERHPLQRMRDGEAARDGRAPERGVMPGLRRAVQDLEAWDPFGEKSA